MSLVTRIFMLIALTLLLVAGGELFNGLNLRQSRLEEARSETVQLARIAELDMVRIIEGTHQLLATLAKLPTDHGWDERACSVLEATANSDFEYDHLAAVDLGGAIQCSSSRAMRVGTPMPDRELLDRIVETAGFTVGSHGTGAVSRNEVIRVGYPVVDDAGTMIGAVYAGINVMWLNTAIGQWKLGEETSIDITDRNGILIARHPNSRGVGQPISDSLKPFLFATGTGTVEVTGADGDVRLYGYVPVVVGSSDGLAVFVGRDQVRIIAGINRSIWRNAVVILIGLLLSAIFAMLYIRRFLARPFERLLAVAGRWRDGDWSVRAGAASGIPEFDRLSLAFDGMAAEVSAHDQSLHARDAIMDAITKCAAELVTAGSIAEAIPRILRTVGEAVDVDRILVLEVQSTGPPVKLRYAWQSLAATVVVRPRYFAAGPNSASSEIAEWLELLRAGRIVAVTRSDARGATKEFFDTFKIASNLRAPILMNGKLWGQVSVDDCRTERSWTPTEIDAISVLADLIGAAMTREHHLEKLSNADAVVRSSPAIVYRLSTVSSPARMTYISDNVSSLGNDPAELLADPELYLTRIHPDDRDAVKAAFRAASAGEGSMEFRIADASGRYRWVENRYKPMHDAIGRLVEVAGVLIDVTDRKSAEERLQLANTLLVTIQDMSPDAILVVDADLRNISFNRRFVEMWRLPTGLIEARDEVATMAAVASQIQDPDAFVARVKYLYEHPEDSAHEELITTDGRFLDRHTAALRTADGRYLGRVWFFRDITERRRADEKIHRMARYDALTGLANRAVFVEALQRAIAEASRSAKSFAVLYLDLDHFKDVNDTLGHTIGDLLLKSVAERLRANMRETDTVARFGGDEFALIGTDILEPADAAVLADRVLKAMSTPFSIHGNEIRIGTSVGIAVYGPDSADAEALLSHADVALYRAKSEGRRTYQFFTEAMDTEVRTRVTLEAELRTAVAAGQFFLLYQPQVDVDTGRIVGLEALVRWRHPTRGVVSPHRFIPVAEQSGLIVALGYWVMHEACRQTKEWLDAGIAPPLIAVNLSGVQFKTPLELENDIAAILTATALPAQLLELELTESVLMEASLEHNDVLLRLRRAGLRIAIDDFGTGYSSLDYLRHFPVDRIKIAQDFIVELTEASGDAAIVRAAIGLADELKLKVVVEGVETAEQLKLVKSWGCHEVQGFYFSKPVSAEEITEHLRIGTIDPARPAAILEAAIA